MRISDWSSDVCSSDLLVSLGCEGFDREGLAAAITQSGRPLETGVIQQAGGTRSSIEAAVAAVRRIQQQMREDERRVPMRLSELVVGTICGGSDGTSGIAANPAVGRAFDRLVDAGAICIFEETGEMIDRKGVV